AVKICRSEGAGIFFIAADILFLDFLGASFMTMALSFFQKRKCLGMFMVVATIVCTFQNALGDKANPVVKEIVYQGWKKNLFVSNGEVDLIITLDVGPRIIQYRLAGGHNVFKEYTDQLGKSGEKTWQIRGGHRFWVGPEDPIRTYYPDNRPVKFEILET